MNEEVDVVICSGYSPGARVLRAAVREAGKREKIRMVTVAPALAQLPKAVEDMESLKKRCVVVVDGCEGFCGLQTLAQFGVPRAGELKINQYAMYSESGVQLEADKIVKLVQEARSKCAKA
ncbi:MAG: putative zinc-binding protein [Euryarchaeota archaeon]|nr:putative zinc-binding protein [Euryarchaeota archaeon]